LLQLLLCAWFVNRLSYVITCTCLAVSTSHFPAGNGTLTEFCKVTKAMDLSHGP
jgi:hypothetical protein